MLCLSSVVPTYAQNIPQEVAVNEPIAMFENGVLYIENLDTSYVGEEIFVVNKDKELKENDIQGRWVAEINDKATIELVDTKGSGRPCGIIEVSYSIMYSDGTSQFYGFTPKSIKYRISGSAPSSFIKFENTEVWCNNSNNSYKIQAEADGYFSGDTTRTLYGYVNK